MNKKWFLFVGVAIALVIVIASLTHRVNPTPDKQRVFAVLPLSGAAAELGNTIKSAIDMYILENQKSILSIQYIDSESSPSKAISGLNQALIGVEKPIVITAVASTSNALIPVVDDHKGFCINLCTVSITPENKAKYNSYQRYSLGIVDAAKPLVEYINNKYSSICIIHSNDEYGMSFYSEFQKKINATVSDVTCSVTPQDMRDVTTKAMATQPEAVLIAGTPTANYRNAVRELRKIGYKGDVLADMSFVNPFIYKNIADAAEGVVTVCSDADITGDHDTWGSAFVEKCIRHSITPYFNTMQSYESIYLIEKIVVETKDLSQDAFARLADLPFADSVVFPGDGEVFFNLFLAKVQNGSLVRLGQ